MFGHNEIVGRKYFEKQDPDTLLVTSRFYTLQGEGPFRGFPAYFIRLTKCNLACTFCDTYFDSGENKSFDELIVESQEEINKFYHTRNMEVPGWATGMNKRIVLVITGGEPTLQENLKEFLQQAKPYFYHSQIESNGIQYLDLDTHTTYVVSPKCSEKQGKAIKYLKPNKDVLDRADCLKFVVSAPETDKYSPYSEVPDWAHTWAAETGKQVFVSPMNIYLKEPEKAKALRAKTNYISIEERSTVDEVISFWEPGLLNMPANQRNHEYAAEYAMKHGFVLNLQAHLYASLP